MKLDSEKGRFTITSNPTDNEVAEFQKGFEVYNLEQTNGEYNSPKDWLSLVLKDHEGNIVGGILTSTLFWIQYLEVLWVDERYRRLGYGRDLILESEKLAKKNGCVASQTYTFSWQGGDFYQAAGYKLIATYDGYVEGIKELILSKRLNRLTEVPSKKKTPLDSQFLRTSVRSHRELCEEGSERTLMIMLRTCSRNIHQSRFN